MTPLEQKIVDLLALDFGYGFGTKDTRRVAKAIALLFTEEREKLAAAFGGCTKCYGKGYATTIEFIQSHEDFGGESTFRKELPRVRRSGWEKTSTGIWDNWRVINFERCRRCGVSKLLANQS